MAKISIILLVVLQYACVAQQKTIVGVDVESLKCKNQIEKYLLNDVNGFSIPYYFSSKSKELGDNYVVVLQGVKNDTLYDLVLTLRGCEVVQSITNPNSTFYMKNDSRVTEYKLGWVYLDFNPNRTCIQTFIEKIEPYKVDTLNFKFKKSMGNLLTQDSIQTCR